MLFCACAVSLSLVPFPARENPNDDLRPNCVLAIKAGGRVLGNAVVVHLDIPGEADGAAIAFFPPPREPVTVFLDAEREVEARFVSFDPDSGISLLEFETAAFGDRAGPVRWSQKPTSAGDLFEVRLPGARSSPRTVSALTATTWFTGGKPRLGLQLSFDGTLTVTQVTAGSTAAWAGVQVGDRLTALDRRPVLDRSAVLELLSTRRAGELLTIGFEHAGTAVESTVRLAFQQATPNAPDAFPAFRTALGDELEPGTPLFDSEGAVAGLSWMSYDTVGGLALSAEGLEAVLRRLVRRGIARTDDDAELRVIARTNDAQPGYTLFAPMRARDVLLVDLGGNVVHRWTSDRAPFSCYLLDDGDLLCCSVEGGNPPIRGGGAAGRLQRFGWDGELEWDYVMSSESLLQHHDIEPLPNGNVLAIVWERRTREELLAAGRAEDAVGEDGLWPDALLELVPVGRDGAEIVWEWHAFDHLVQDVDPNKPNYGDVGLHRHRVDVNADRDRSADSSAEERQRLERLGYLQPERDRDPRRTRGGGRGGDWTHVNSVDYNASLDQIVLSSRELSEVWVIDHSTTIEEARGSTGGRSGKGGDLLYRWGNPRTYRRGTRSEQQLENQHDARWVPEGYPGAGNLMVFNNGAQRGFSSVDEFTPPLDANGHYFVDEDLPFEPCDLAWTYADGEQFFSSHLSGAHRLRNGNTFICSGSQGRLFEVTAQGEIAWELHVGGAGGMLTPAPISGPAALGLGGLGLDGRGGPGGGGVFRATRIEADAPGLKGRTLRPIDPASAPTNSTR